MDSTVTITEAQAQFPALVRQAQKTGSVMVVRHGKPAAFILSPAQMEGILETMEILANPRAMHQIRLHQAGKAKFHDVSALDED